MRNKPAHSWDSLSNLLVLAAIFLSSLRLQSTAWVIGLEKINTIALLGCFIGLALGYSQFEKRTIAWLSLGYMFVFILWQLMGTIDFGSTPLPLLEKISIVFGRLFTAIRELSSGRAIKDPFFLLTLLCLPYGFASLYSGFNLTRHTDFLKAILPNGALMFIIHIYHLTSNHYTWMFGIYFFIALILLSRLKYLKDRREWAQNRVQISSQSGMDITTTSLIVTTLLVFAAWAAPYTISPSPEGILFWRNTYGKVFNPNRFENLFAAVDKENQPKPRNFQTELSLGTRTPQSDQVVFKVYAPQSAANFPRMYWRGQVYDRFEDNIWSITGETEIKRYPAEGDMSIPNERFKQRLGFTFDITMDGQSVLYTAAQPIWINHEAIMLYSEIDEEVYDVAAFRASPKLEQGDLYRTASLMANPSIVELRQAGQEYPDWVVEKYLQVPENLSPRIRETALNITTPYETAYDKAAAITLYLRREINYSPSVEIPKNTADPLDYVLFEGKRAYCNYYATLQVLMLRSLGIPARLAVGYAQGEVNLQNSLFIVRERDLHAWPEVYFPQIGWVEFEPTVNQEALIRPETREDIQLTAPLVNPTQSQTPFEEDLPTPEIIQAEEQASANGWLNGLITTLPWFGGVIFILLLIGLQKRFAPTFTPVFILQKVSERSGWRLPKWLVFANLPSIEKYFHSINLVLKWLNRPQAAHITPAERAWILKHTLPEAAEDIEILLNEHQSQLFSPLGGSSILARRAAIRVLTKGLQKKLKRIILGYNYKDIQEPPRYSL